ncbi:MAG: hypothetical protein QW688_08320 [Thermoprotei archaeon]
MLVKREGRRIVELDITYLREKHVSKVTERPGETLTITFSRKVGEREAWVVNFELYGQVIHHEYDCPVALWGEKLAKVWFFFHSKTCLDCKFAEGQGGG